MSTPKTPHTDPQLITFGCRLNTFESEVMRKHAKDAKLQNAVIINTCAVTKEAERQARQTIRKLRRDQPDARIIVTGCAAQLDGRGFGDMAEVDLVLGNDEKLRPESYMLDSPAFQTRNDPVLVTDIMQVEETAPHLIAGFDAHTRAFVQIQQGCDHRCTFCIIPFARGPNRSIPLGQIVAQIKQLVENGYQEVVLTGVDVASYGSDLPGSPNLAQAIKRILNLVPDLPRLRMSSIDPVAFQQDFIDLIASEQRLLPHFHLSAQHGHDLILKRMKRRHTRADMITACARVRAVRPDAVFGADIICGFPTEDDTHFKSSVDLVADCGLTHLHVFSYSPRPGTPAARMPQVNGAVAKERTQTLRAVGQQALRAFMQSRVGKTEQILVEKDNTGHTAQYIPCKISSPTPITAGSLCAALITDVADEHLIGEIL